MSREDNLIKFEKGHKPLPPNPEKMKAKKAGKFNLKAVDGILVDRNLGIVAF